VIDLEAVVAGIKVVLSDDSIVSLSLCINIGNGVQNCRMD